MTETQKVHTYSCICPACLALAEGQPGTCPQCLKEGPLVKVLFGNGIVAGACKGCVDTWGQMSSERGVPL